MAAKKKVKVEDLSPEALMKAVNDRFGEGTMRKASDPSLAISRIPTGILSLDWRLHGGFPRGRYTELFGNASVGKTTAALKAIAQAQKMGLRAAYIDVERSFDPDYAAHLGVDVDELSFHSQVHGNRVVDFMEVLLRSGLYDIVVMDSIAALLPVSEMETDMEAGSMGTEQAKLMSKALRKLTAANTNTAVIFINQLRDNVGTMFGKRSITSGGRALSFYAGIRIEMVKIESLKQKRTQTDPKSGKKKSSDMVVGHRVLFKVTKNKTGGARTDEQGTFVFDYEAADIDHIEDLIYVGVLAGWVHQKGDYWWVEEFADERQHGRPKFTRWLKKNTVVAEELESWIQEAMTAYEEETNEA